MKSLDILILGSGGLFGSAMEAVCKEAGEKVCGLTHKEIDIYDNKQLEGIIKEKNPNLIINAAAMMGIAPCEENPIKAFQINTVSALNLAKICKNSNITLVHTSTNAIFDGKKGAPYVETDTPNPQNIYGLSKYAGEICVGNHLNDYYIIRFPKLFGARTQKNATAGFTDKILEKMRKGEEVKIADDRFDPFTYTVHAAKKILELVNARAPFGIYHVANQGSISYYEFISRFAKMVGYNGKITAAKDKDFPSPAPNPLRTELDSIKIKNMPSVDKAMEDYLEREKIRL